MERKKIDRRIRKTEAQLRKGLLELLKKKNIQDITVKELVDTVDINRSTFYLHYKDIYDLLEKIEADYFKDFKVFLAAHQKEKTGNPSEDNEKITQTFIDYFTFLKEHEDLITAVVGYDADPAFSRRQISRLTQGVYEWMYDDMGILKSQQTEDVFEYCLSGAIGLVHSWVVSGYAESPESIGRLISDIITFNVRQFILKEKF